MKKIIKPSVLLTFLVCITQFLQAQEIKGYVYEYAGSNPIWNASVKNIRTNETINTSKDGFFQIPGVINDYLLITATGYLTDTIFYYEDAIRRIYLNRDDKVLTIDEVLVKRLTDNRLAMEITRAKSEGKTIETSQEKGGIRISPSRIFGKKAKEARANLALLEAEQEARKVDRVFTTQLIASVTPLTQEEIPLFRERFRPTLEFIQKSNQEELKSYISDSYKVFKEN